jgi:hypothetical protein
MYTVAQQIACIFFIQIHNLAVEKKNTGQVFGHSEDFVTDQVGRLLIGFQPLKQCYHLNALNMQF